jgi:phage FluMu protein Com
MYFGGSLTVPCTVKILFCNVIFLFYTLASMKEVKCPNCGRVLLEANLKDGAVRKKCKCGHLLTIEVRPAGQPAPYQNRVVQATK